MTHMPPIFEGVDDTDLGAKQQVGYQYSTMQGVIHEVEKVCDRKTINIILKPCHKDAYRKRFLSLSRSTGSFVPGCILYFRRNCGLFVTSMSVYIEPTP